MIKTMFVPTQSCPCGDIGFHVVPDGDGEPMQERCEFCYTVPYSRFNVLSICAAYDRDRRKVEPVTVTERIPF